MTGSIYGQRLITSLIDEYSRQSPDRIYALLLQIASESIVPQVITFPQLGNAIDQCAFWLESCCGKGVNFETIAYLSRSDLRTSILIVAAVKVGFKVMMLGRLVYVDKADKPSFFCCLLATLLKRIWTFFRKQTLCASSPRKSSRA